MMRARFSILFYQVLVVFLIHACLMGQVLAEGSGTYSIHLMPMNEKETQYLAIEFLPYWLPRESLRQVNTADRQKKIQQVDKFETLDVSLKLQAASLLLQALPDLYRDETSPQQAIDLLLGDQSSIDGDNGKTTEEEYQKLKQIIAQDLGVLMRDLVTKKPAENYLQQKIDEFVRQLKEHDSDLRQWGLEGKSEVIEGKSITWIKSTQEKWYGRYWQCPIAQQGSGIIASNFDQHCEALFADLPIGRIVGQSMQPPKENLSQKFIFLDSSLDDLFKQPGAAYQVLHYRDQAVLMMAGFAAYGIAVKALATISQGASLAAAGVGSTRSASFYKALYRSGLAAQHNPYHQQLLLKYARQSGTRGILGQEAANLAFAGALAGSAHDGVQFASNWVDRMLYALPWGMGYPFSRQYWGPLSAVINRQYLTSDIVNNPNLTAAGVFPLSQEVTMAHVFKTLRQQVVNLNVIVKPAQVEKYSHWGANAQNPDITRTAPDDNLTRPWQMSHECIELHYQRLPGSRFR